MKNDPLTVEDSASLRGLARIDRRDAVQQLTDHNLAAPAPGAPAGSDTLWSDVDPKALENGPTPAAKSELNDVAPRQPEGRST